MAQYFEEYENKYINAKIILKNGNGGDLELFKGKKRNRKNYRNFGYF